ncbi:hypothetical protein Tco_0059529 [Tanacetum coccineum]
MNKVLQERGFRSLPSSTETNPWDHVKSISTAVETNMTLTRRIGSTRYATYLNLGLGELAHTKLIIELADRTVKHPKGIAENVLVWIIMENMDIYPNRERGDVIIGEPFCKVSCVDARRFDRLITIHNGDNNVTYQMTRSHPRFKQLSNEKCNKIPTLLKVSAQDELNGISHSYQKLKTFYQGILDLGPEYIRDEKIVERHTRGHISMDEME